MASLGPRHGRRTLLKSLQQLRRNSHSTISAAAYEEIVAECAGNQYNLYAALHERYGDVLLQKKDDFGVDIVT